MVVASVSELAFLEPGSPIGDLDGSVMETSSVSSNKVCAVGDSPIGLEFLHLEILAKLCRWVPIWVPSYPRNWPEVHILLQVSETFSIPLFEQELQRM